MLQRFLDVCNAMQYAHDRGVLHRDLKPGNIMLGQYGETLVIDWGLAKSLGESKIAFVPAANGEKPWISQSSHSGSGSETVPGSKIGSPLYMSPEQAAGKVDELGSATDVYSLGATLYHILTGRPPYLGKKEEHLDELYVRIQRGDYPTPREVKSNAPRAVGAICLKAMRLKPNDRYLAPAELAAEVDRVLADEPVTVLAESISDRLFRVGRKHRGALTAVLAASILITVSSTIAMLIFNHQRQLNAELAERNNEIAKENEQLAVKEKVQRVKAEQYSEEKSKLAQVAIKNERLAVSQAVEFRSLSGQLSLTQGLEFCRTGDVARGLLHLSEALTLIADNPGGSKELEYVIRANLGAWQQRIRPLRRVLPAPDGWAISRACWSSDGRTLVMACNLVDEKQIKIGEIHRWDANTGELIRSEIKLDSPIQAMASSSKGDVLLAGCEDGSVHRWTPEAGTERSRHSDANPITALKFSPDGRQYAAGLQSGEVELRNAASEAKTFVFQRRISLSPEPFVRDVAFSPDGRLLASVCNDGFVYVWNISERKLAYQDQLRLPTSVRAAAFSPNGEAFYTGTAKGKIYRWNTANGTSIGPPLTDNDGVECIVFTSERSQLITGSAFRSVQVWDASSGKESGEPLLHDAAIRNIEVSPNQETLLTATANDVRLWELPAPSAVYGATEPELRAGLAGLGNLRTILCQDYPVGTIAMSRDGQKILAGTIVLDRQGRNIFEDLEAPGENPNQLEAARQALQSTGEVRLWDAVSFQPLGPPISQSRPVFASGFSRDGERFLTGSGVPDHHPHRWQILGLKGETGHFDVATQARIGETLISDRAVVSVAFDPTSQRFVTACFDKTAKIWQVERVRPSDPCGKLLRTLKHPQPVESVCFSPDGKKILTGCADKKARIWDAETGTQEGEPIWWVSNPSLDKPDSEMGISGIAYSPDGRYILMGGGSSLAQLYDTKTSTYGKSFPHKDAVRAVDFSPDGRLILTGSRDNLARVWESKTGYSVGPPLEHQGWVGGVIYSLDGKTILTGSKDTTVRIWDAPFPIAGNAERLHLWTEITTGLRLDASNEAEPLSASDWHRRWQRLQSLGGNPRSPGREGK